MQVRVVRLRQYRVPFRQPYVTARGRASFREGVLVELVTSDGVTGLGESAPRPDGPFSSDAFASAVLAAARSMAGRNLDAIVSRGFPAGVGLFVAGLETAAWDAVARRQGVRLGELLSPSPLPSVAANALINEVSIEDLELAARAAKSSGYRTVKLKCGACASLEEEAERVVAARDALGPDIALRLDANGAWEESFALNLLRRIETCRIDYVEQPLPPGNVDAMRRLRRAAGVAIAADEDVASMEAAMSVLEAEAADVLVLKPLQLGGIGPTRRIADAARERGVRAVITTTVDTGVGTAAALHLAAAIGSDEAAGLATLPLLESGVVRPKLAVQDGRMLLPDGAGLGIDLDEVRLERYVIRTWEVTA